MDWTRFLSGVLATDYIFQDTPYEEQIEEAVLMLQNAEHILIGAGAGLSAAAGLTYSGSRFQENFPEFIEKYGMKDMYSAGFYPFSSEEERWGYWSKHSLVNRIEPPALPLYRDLCELVGEKDYFVITTNVDHQFFKAGFEKNRIFATQGDYGKIQCAKGCHRKTYDAIDLFQQMNQARKDCRIPSSMVPKCPVCGGAMAMHLRCDSYFVEDEEWQEAANRYGAFFTAALKNERTVLLELGVGFNTPVIIKFGFHDATRKNKSANYICVNLFEAAAPVDIQDRSICIQADIAKVVSDLLVMQKSK